LLWLPVARRKKPRPLRRLPLLRLRSLPLRPLLTPPLRLLLAPLLPLLTPLRLSRALLRLPSTLPPLLPRSKSIRRSASSSCTKAAFGRLFSWGLRQVAGIQRIWIPWVSEYFNLNSRVVKLDLS
jgi:hypothetical protein